MQEKVASRDAIEERFKNLYGFEMREPDRRIVPKRSYEIKRLWQRNHEIVNLAAMGYNNKEIAEILNITPATVSNTLNSEVGLKKLSDLRKARDEEAKKVHEKIRILTKRALDVYHQILEDDSGIVSMKEKKAAADTVVLELSGLRVPTKIQSHSISTILSPEELEEIKARGKAAARESGLCIGSETQIEESKNDPA